METQSTTASVAAHTPGPWRVIDETDVLALEGTPSSIVVASTKFFEGPSTDRERANARLIAAAPELLEALKNMARVCEGVCYGWPGGDPFKHIADARALIAKATGVQS